MKVSRSTGVFALSLVTLGGTLTATYILSRQLGAPSPGLLVGAVVVFMAAIAVSAISVRAYREEQQRSPQDEQGR